MSFEPLAVSREVTFAARRGVGLGRSLLGEALRRTGGIRIDLITRSGDYGDYPLTVGRFSWRRIAEQTVALYESLV